MTVSPTASRSAPRTTSRARRDGVALDVAIDERAVVALRDGRGQRHDGQRETRAPSRGDRRVDEQQAGASRHSPARRTSMHGDPFVEVVPHGEHGQHVAASARAPRRSARRHRRRSTAVDRRGRPAPGARRARPRSGWPRRQIATRNRARWRARRRRNGGLKNTTSNRSPVSGANRSPWRHSMRPHVRSAPRSCRRSAPPCG